MKKVCPICRKTHRPNFVYGNAMGMGKRCAQQYMRYTLSRRKEVDQLFKELNKEAA